MRTLMLTLALVVTGCGSSSVTPSPAAPTAVTQSPAAPAPSTATATPTQVAGSAATPAVPSPAASPRSSAATPVTGAESSAAAVGAAPDCTAPAELTREQTEGPYYTGGAPERSDLREPGMAGTQLTLTGFVVTVDCTPVVGAKVDVWQADAAGEYDNEGYRLRGYVLTDASGAFRFETIVPGEYPGRTEHIHVKVTAPSGPTLTTQLYFPDPGNASDRIFDEQTVLVVTEVGDALHATYTFVVAT